MTTGNDPNATGPRPTGWVVMQQFEGGPHMVLPTWINQDSDGDTTAIIGHPGGVIINGSLDSDVASLAFTAMCILAACESTQAQRLRGQAAVAELLERIRPEGDTTTLADLIERGIKEGKEKSQRATEAHATLADLFDSLRKTLGDIDRRNPESPPEQGSES